MTQNLEPTALPALLPQVTGLDELRAAAQGLAERVADAVTDLVDREHAIRHHVLGGATPTLPDVAPLIRQLANAAEVLDLFRAEAAKAAMACKTAIQPELDDIRQSYVQIPDADGSWKVVADSKRETVVPEVGEVLGVLARYGLELHGHFGGDADQVAAYECGVVEGCVELLRLVSVSWRSTALDGLVALLMTKGLDGTAGSLRRAYRKDKTPLHRASIERK